MRGCGDDGLATNDDRVLIRVPLVLNTRAHLIFAKAQAQAAAKPVEEVRSRPGEMPRRVEAPAGRRMPPGRYSRIVNDGT